MSRIGPDGSQREQGGVVQRILEQAHDMGRLAVQSREELAAVAGGSVILV